MATLNYDYSFSNNTVADANQVNANFANAKTFVENQLVHVDGSVKAGLSALDFALTGIIVPYVGLTAPTGWLLCRGQLVSKSAYSGLYTVVGPNAFGTDTATEFYLPNLQGRVPVGVSTSDTDFDRADVGGVKSVTLTAAQSGLPAHQHAITDQPHNHGILGEEAVNVLDVLNGDGQRVLESNTFNVVSNEITANSLTGITSTQSTIAQGAIEAHTNLQPYIALNFIVKT